MQQLLVGKQKAVGKARNRYFTLPAMTVVASWFPYAGLPFGKSSQLSLCVLLTGISVFVQRVNLVRLPIGIIVFVALPLLAGAMQVILGLPLALIAAVVTWPLYTSPLLLAQGISGPDLRRHLLVLTRIMMGLASLFALVQQATLVRTGTILFAKYYNLQPYTPLDLDSIARYVRRPFGWFPEPSLLAIAMCLGSLMLMVLVPKSLERVDQILILVALATAVFAKSGLVFVITPFVLLAGIRRLSSGRSKRVASLLLPILGGAAYFLVWRERGAAVSSGQNFSWTDRWYSIQIPLASTLTSLKHFLFGFGPGSTTQIFESGYAQANSSHFHNPPSDVLSLLGGLIVQVGWPVALTMLILLLTYMHKALRSTTGDAWFATFVTAGWVLIGLLSLAYLQFSLYWMAGSVFSLHHATQRKEAHHDATTISKSASAG